MCDYLTDHCTRAGRTYLARTRARGKVHAPKVNINQRTDLRSDHISTTQQDDNASYRPTCTLHNTHGKLTKPSGGPAEHYRIEDNLRLSKVSKLVVAGRIPSRTPAAFLAITSTLCTVATVRSLNVAEVSAVST